MYGKINRIVKNSGSTIIDYGYDPGGNRTFKKVTIEDTVTTTFYIRDAQGNVMGIYTQKDEDPLKWSEQHLYGSSRLGIWKWDAEVPASAPNVIEEAIFDSLMFGMRQYELSNHLGNVLSTISDKKVGHDSSGVVDYYVAEVLSQNDYYPFGMGMPGRQYSVASGYRYGFNEKEKDSEQMTEGNTYDYGFRIYNAKVGRFLCLDPLTRVYPWYTPYQFAGNTPIFAIDLDGLEIRNAYYEYCEDGSTLGLKNPDNKKIKKLAEKVDEALAQLQNDDPELFNWANQFNIKIQGATREEIKKYGRGNNEAGFIKTDITFSDESFDPDSRPALAYNELYGKDAWSKFKESNPEGAEQFASDFKGGKIIVYTSRSTTVNEQNIYIDFDNLDDILSGRVKATDATTGRAIQGLYGETLKHEIGHFIYQLLGVIYRNKAALENGSADESSADNLDATFDSNPSTQTSFLPLFFKRPPPKQTLKINQADCIQATSEINSSPSTPTKKI